MASKLNKLISFKNEHKFVYDYLKTKGNASQYIIDLIINDMKYNDEDKIRLLIKQVILEDFNGVPAVATAPNTNNTLAEEERLNLFSIEDDE